MIPVANERAAIYWPSRVYLVASFACLVTSAYSYYRHQWGLNGLILGLSIGNVVIGIVWCAIENQKRAARK